MRNDAISLTKFDFNTVAYILRHPGLVHILRRWKGLRHTDYFRRAMRFYRHIARKDRPSFFTPPQKGAVTAVFNADRAISDAMAFTPAHRDFRAAAAGIEQASVQFARRLRRLRLRQAG